MNDHADAPVADSTAIAFVLQRFAQYRDRVAIRYKLGEWTYADLLARIYRMTRALHAQGLGRGDVLAVLTGNHPETFVLRYSANALGAATTILYDDLAAPLLIEMLRATDASMLVYDPDWHTHEAHAIAQQTKIRVLTLGESTFAVNLEAQAAAQPAKPSTVLARVEDLSEIRLTGGSTGTPKGIPRTSRIPGYLAPTALHRWEDSIQLLCTPIGHLGGTLAEVALAAGGRVVLHEHFDPGNVLTAIENEHVNYLWANPNHLHRLLDHPALDTTDTSSLRALHLGSWASTPQRVAEAIRRLGPVIVQGYGANEVGQVTWLGQEEHLKSELLTTVGKPVPGVEVTIRNRQGEPTDAGTTGEIWVRSPGMMTGYYRQPEQTAEALQNGWFHTGDLGVINNAGYLTIAGRINDIIITTNGHIYPSAIEELLLQHPAIVQAVVFGYTTSGNDEQVCAAIVPTLKNSITQDDVVDWVAKNRGGAYSPEVVLICESLPTTGSGKPDRNALRATVASLRDSSPNNQ